MHELKNFTLGSGVLLLALVLAGCGSAPTTYRTPDAEAALSAPSRVSQEQAHDITMYAVGLVGTPYRYGGNTPAAGFDCSGLIGHVLQTQAALAPPRTVARLQTWGQPVDSSNIRSGDVVLFAQSEVATHAGIYVGEGRFVHAPSTGGMVRLDNLNSKYWSQQQVAFRRP